MALSFHPTTASVFGHLPEPDAKDVSFLQDVHPEVTDALIGFVYEPLDPASACLDDLLNLPRNGDFLGPIVHDDDACFLDPVKDEDAKTELHCAKKLRLGTDNLQYGLADIDPVQQCNGNGNYQGQLPALPELPTEFVLPLPPFPPQPQPQPLVFVRRAEAKKAGGNSCQSVQSTVAGERRKRIREKTAELSRRIPGGHKPNTAEMLEEAARHVKLLQAQVGMLALMHKVGSTEEKKMPSMAREEMHALLACRSVQGRLAAEGKCLVPRTLVDVVARDKVVRSNAVVNRGLGRLVASLEQ